MADVLHAISIAAGVLLTIVGLIVVVTFAAVKRGEAQMEGLGTDRRVWWNMGPRPVAVGPDGAAVVGAKPVVVVDASVMQILLLGGGLFVLAVLGLLAVSIIAHL